MNRLLVRQLKRAMRINGAGEFDFLLGQIQLSIRRGVIPLETAHFIEGFRELVKSVDATYDHTDRHLELLARSLELSSEDVEAAQAELLELSRTDALTRLWNRGYWSERLNEEFSRVQRLGDFTSLAILDIDHFKRINDTFGHPAGDAVIQRTAEILKSTARSIDFCGRYGGEEFAVILPGTHELGAVHFAESLRARIENESLAYEGKEIKYTISLGIATWSSKVDSVKTWLVRADEALYTAKRSGRNQVCTYRALTPALPETF